MNPCNVTSFSCHHSYGEQTSILIGRYLGSDAADAIAVRNVAESACCIKELEVAGKLSVVEKEYIKKKEVQYSFVEEVIL